MGVVSSFSGLVHREYGEPKSVLFFETLSGSNPLQQQSDLAPDDVLIRMKASPINPSDINMMAGTYFHQPALPVIPGKEGVGEVVAVGKAVTTVRVGDWVILPYESEERWTGWWSELIVAKASDVFGVPSDLDALQLAMLTINPVTAWVLLHEMVSLKPGDWVIQNAANSGVGRCVIQLAKVLGLQTYNFVRRPMLIDELMALGATCVSVDSDADVTGAKLLLGSSCRLALNGVGGASAVRLSKLLSVGGTLVTYGAMSKESVLVSNGQLIYKDLRFRGFLRARWVRQAKRQQVDDTLTILLNLIRTGQLVQPVDRSFSLSDYLAAFDRVAALDRNGKVLFQ